MENNKDRNITQAPMDDALENELEVQTVQPDEASLEEVDSEKLDSGKLDEIIESLDTEATPEATGEGETIRQPLSEVEAAKAKLARTEETVREAEAEIETGKAMASKATKEVVEAKKALAEQKKQIREAVRKEKRQKKQEAAAKSKEERAQELERRKAALQHTKAEMGEKLRGLLSGELKAMEKYKKTRAAEIMAVFAKHNFYANGFTPVELRTTLEDLGPTYVKIGQIMSSRVDMLPESYCKEQGAGPGDCPGGDRAGDRQEDRRYLPGVPGQADRLGVHRPGPLRGAEGRHEGGHEGAAAADRGYDARGFRAA